MRLYLSSYRLGDHPEHLRALFGERARVAVIANALDAVPAELRAEMVDRELADLAGLGLTGVELDLRSSVDLQGYDGVWVRGGNVFVLRAAFLRSGFDLIVKVALQADSIIYAGYSAGACVLAPSLRGLELCDPVGEVDGEVVWDGLGLIDEAIVPHLDSPGHPETDLVRPIADLYRRTGVPHLTLRDGQALLVTGTSRQVV